MAHINTVLRHFIENLFFSASLNAKQKTKPPSLSISETQKQSYWHSCQFASSLTHHDCLWNS